MGPPNRPLSAPPSASVPGLDQRSALILRELVETYVATGEPVGSRTLSRRLPMNLSPATIRNAMADLEDAGLLYAPHTSAGRLPTERGLRLFVDALLEFGLLTEEERGAIDARCAASGRSLQDTLGEAGNMLAGLAGATGLVVAPKTENPVRHIEFVALGPGRALVVLVQEGGQVENRIIDIPPGLPPSALVQASNYLNARLNGRTLDEARTQI
ncbi:MAG TPA: heat-inducible transcriptional repressor HrcA, partial [Acetobacteraceae bacterium]|nr:heat-inducible transcriptional repressor HrcA [Acetobacteraceae bacterium]